VCPFFGDQHFWGEMVHRKRVGPRPCPVGSLTVPLITEGLALLRDPKVVANAAALAEEMSHEDGVESACQAFYKHLPLENMLCDVSLFREEYRLAQVRGVPTSCR
jgi:sterol 3beta-glucosyltransferase